MSSSVHDDMTSRTHARAIYIIITHRRSQARPALHLIRISDEKNHIVHLAV